jgi:hypothetical protein
MSLVRIIQESSDHSADLAKQWLSLGTLFCRNMERKC